MLKLFLPLCFMLLSQLAGLAQTLVWEYTADEPTEYSWNYSESYVLQADSAGGALIMFVFYDADLSNPDSIAITATKGIQYHWVHRTGKLLLKKSYPANHTASYRAQILTPNKLTLIVDHEILTATYRNGKVTEQTSTLANNEFPAHVSTFDPTRRVLITKVTGLKMRYYKLP